MLRPSNDSSIFSISNQETIRLFVDENISWTIQLIKSIAFTSIASDRFDIFFYQLLFDYVMIPVVSSDNALILIIDVDSTEPVELIAVITTPIFTSRCHSIL